MATPTTIDTDTELSAVNSILGAIGQSPVTTLGSITEITGETNYTTEKVTATNTRSGYTVTVTKNDHGLNTGYTIDWDFLNNGSSDGVFTITKVNNNTFTFTDLSSGALSSSVGAYTTRTYDIGLTFTNKSEIQLEIDNVHKTQNIDYTISGSYLTLTATGANNLAVGKPIKIYREKIVVNTLANPEISFIYNILTEVNKDVQNESWVFNTEYNVEKAPEAGTKHITIPSDVLRYDLNEDNTYRNKNLIRKNGKLWDTINQTYEFDDPVRLDITWLRPFEEIPNAFQRYIISRASVRAATQLVSNPQLVQLLQTQEALTRATCAEYECLQGDHSYMGFPDNNSYRTYQPYTVLRR